MHGECMTASWLLWVSKNFVLYSSKVNISYDNQVRSMGLSLYSGIKDLNEMLIVLGATHLCSSLHSI